MTKHVYFFGAGEAEGDGHMTDLLGGKGAHLAQMTKLGMRVPPGFTISSRMCAAYFAAGRKRPAELDVQIDEALRGLEAVSGARFGDAANPLLVSVRSGAAVSMPGMMDTVLNVGLNDDTVVGLRARRTTSGSRWTAIGGCCTCTETSCWACPTSCLKRQIEALKQASGAASDTDLTVADLQLLVEQYKQLILEQTGAAVSKRTAAAAVAGCRQRYLIRGIHRVRRATGRFTAFPTIWVPR